MSGKTESSIETKLKVIQETLDKYEDTLGLNNTRLDPEIKEILNKTFDEIKALTPELCGNYAFILARYSLYIQSECNKHNRIYNWCESNLNLITSKRSGNYNGVTFEERKASVLHEDELAKQLYQAKQQSKLMLDSISFISEKVKYLSQTLISIQQFKRGQNV